MPAVYDTIEQNRLILEQFLIYFQNGMMDNSLLLVGENARIECMRDCFDRLIFFVKSWIIDGHKEIRKETEKINFPATPWQHFKQVYVPKCFLKRYPVKFTTTEVQTAEHHHFLCPHVSMKDDRSKHMMWIYENKTKTVTD